MLVDLIFIKKIESVFEVICWGDFWKVFIKCEFMFYLLNVFTFIFSIMLLSLRLLF